MPVVIKYVVARDGIEKMTFTSKADADAYDKMLDTADALYELLDNSHLAGDHNQKEALSLYLAEHKDELLEALGAKRKTASKSQKKNNNAPQKTNHSTPLELAHKEAKKPLEDLVIEPDEDAFYEEPDIIIDEEELTGYTDSDAA
ncbi:DNA damage-inducible protein YebG [Marinomonas spartinae]|uniref:DNA damage-inducible protein YebG n=1 Tax=Marinomonas spartinae TaxID=1792290 RepID=A0A1A8TT28_9GAMM|nr:DNA damage-inducible protein YebG [Marinomonas spartinae]SBS36862.1 DNA damage-inducible protein YebG [Marinomonas spartinae]